MASHILRFCSFSLMLIILIVPAVVLGLILSSPTTVYESDCESESEGEETQRFDPRKHSILLPNTPEWDARAKRNQRKARPRGEQEAQKKVVSTKRRNHGPQRRATFNDLSDDCLVQIMYHLELPTQQQKTSTLDNMLQASIRMKRLYLKNPKAILAGMQEKQFPEYLPIFGRVGRQSTEHLGNVTLAWLKRRWTQDHILMRPDRYRCLNEQNRRWTQDHIVMRPDRHRCLNEQKGHGIMCEDCFIGFLQKLAHTTDREIYLIHRLEAARLFPPHIVRHALVTFWRMGWFRIQRDVHFTYERPVLVAMDGNTIWRLFQEQDRMVQDCLRSILFALGMMIKRNLQLTLNFSEGALALSTTNAASILDAQKSYDNLAQDIDVSVLLTMIIYGAEAIFKMGVSWDHRPSRYLREWLNKFLFRDAAGSAIRARCSELDDYAQLAEKLGFRLGCLEDFEAALLRRVRFGIQAQQAQLVEEQADINIQWLGNTI